MLSFLYSPCLLAMRKTAEEIESLQGGGITMVGILKTDKDSNILVLFFTCSLKRTHRDVFIFSLYFTSEIVYVDFRYITSFLRADTNTP